MRKIIFLTSILVLVSVALSEDIVDAKDSTTIKAEDNEETTTIIEDVETATDIGKETTPDNKPVSSSTEGSIDSFENETDSEETDEESMPSKPGASPQRRKVLYVNQQQHGKLNVQFELNDVSLIVIPNKRDPQLSLLSLLLKSAQKSNNLKQKDNKKKEETTKVEDDYSKYNYMHTSTNEPSIESRAPYKVDISSILNSQPIVEITHPSEESHMTRSAMLKVKKPIVFQSPQHNSHLFKRSIDSNVVGKGNDVVDISDIPADSQEIINSIEDADNLDEFNQEDVNSTSEFVLLGATENCGPGRRRNSYQICVPITE